MSYARRLGRRPMEQASKSSHGYVINDPSVKAFLGKCALPRTASEVALAQHVVLEYQPVEVNPIRHIVAVDSGFSEVPVRSEFPSSTLCFFQFGALTFSIADLESLQQSAFIDPSDMGKLKRIERLKLTLPVRNIALKDQKTLTDSVRVALHEFFKEPRDGSNLLDTLRWFLFEEYSSGVDKYNLASCPRCWESNITVSVGALSADGVFACERCGASLLLTDVFRLHEAVDDEVGAGGILGYVTTLLEQIVMIHFLRLILSQQPSLLNQILFVKDGPLAFFGQTANMHRKMRALATHLFDKHALYMVGLEKSGAFVEHAAEVSTIMKDGTVLLLDNDYIYKYIIPGKADPANAYGGTTYYSAKVVFKSRHAGVYVASLPTPKPTVAPTLADIPNLMAVLTNVEKLRCDMYDDALIPVALVNKLVSLANHPSSKILQRFALDGVHH